MTTESEPQAIERVRSTRERRRQKIIVLLSALLLVLCGAGGSYVVIGLVSQCGAGIEERGGECTGVTDGSYSFDPRLDDVTKKIKAENDAIKGQQSVTVAVLMPLTAPAHANLSMPQIRSYLEGAYIAQSNANQSESNLKIRLVLANEGSEEQAWAPVVQQLRSMVNDQSPLRAVTGFGLSVTETLLGAKELAKSELPMIGYLSADQLNSTSVPGLTRVTPSLRTELETLAAHFRERDLAPSAMLVHDSNPNDLYTASLRNDFETVFRDFWERGGLLKGPYDGTPGTTGIESQFGLIADRLCSTDSPNMVMYAGRAVLLPTFIRQLRHRNCATDRPITVVTGSDASDLRITLEKPKRADAPVSLVYASVSDPAGLDNPALNPDWGNYDRFRRDFDAEFDAKDLWNGWGLMAHDAMLTATKAIHLTAGQSGKIPGPQEIRGTVALFNHPNNEIHGASGTFQLDSDTGDRISRQIPVLELTANGDTKVLRVRAGSP